MGEVMGRAAIAIVDNMRRIGVPTEAAMARLPVREAALRDPTCRIEWTSFAELLDELEAACGSAEAFERAFSEVQPTLFSDFLPLLRFALSPRDLYRLVYALMRVVYPHIRFTAVDDADGRHVVTIEIPPPHRPCAAYLHACAGGIRSTPAMLGFPPVHVSRELTSRRGVFAITLPESRTLGARLRRASSSLVMKAAVAEVEKAWLETRRRISELEATNTRLVELTRRLEAEVELRSRAEVALRAVVDAASGSLAADSSAGRIALLRDPRSHFAVRLECVGERWQLSARHIDVLGLVVRGMSNKDIAAQLGCAMHTVEHHVSEVLRRSGQESRSALTAAFWSDA